MAKKCFQLGQNRIYCIETMTLFIVFLIFLISCYLLLFQQNKLNNINLNPFQLQPMTQPITQPIIKKIPVNIETQNTGESFRQIGILTKQNDVINNGNPIIIPLMGKRSLQNSNRWKYYTIHNESHSQLPISKGSSSCIKEQGCDEIYNGDQVYVEGFKELFIATIYDTPTLEYIPYINY